MNLIFIQNKIIIMNLKDKTDLTFTILQMIKMGKKKKMMNMKNLWLNKSKNWQCISPHLIVLKNNKMNIAI